MGTAAGRRLYATQDATQVSSGHLLQTNRTTMDRLQTLLKNDCSYCAQHIDLGILLSTAVSKMLAWYRAVLDSMAESPAKNASPPPRIRVHNAHHAWRLPARPHHRDPDESTTPPLRAAKHLTAAQSSLRAQQPHSSRWRGIFLARQTAAQVTRRTDVGDQHFGGTRLETIYGTDAAMQRVSAFCRSFLNEAGLAFGC